MSVNSSLDAFHVTWCFVQDVFVVSLVSRKSKELVAQSSPVLFASLKLEDEMLAYKHPFKQSYMLHVLAFNNMT